MQVDDHNVLLIHVETPKEVLKYYTYTSDGVELWKNYLFKDNINTTIVWKPQKRSFTIVMVFV